MEMEGWVMLNEEDVNRQAKGIVVNGSLDLEDEEESFFCDFCKFQSGFSFSLKYFRLILLAGELFVGGKLECHFVFSLL